MPMLSRYSSVQRRTRWPSAACRLGAFDSAAGNPQAGRHGARDGFSAAVFLQLSTTNTAACAPLSWRVVSAAGEDCFPIQGERLTPARQRSRAASRQHCGWIAFRPGGTGAESTVQEEMLRSRHELSASGFWTGGARPRVYDSFRRWGQGREANMALCSLTD